MIFLIAAAAGVLVSPSGDTAEIRLKLDREDRPAARTAIAAAARQTCAVLAMGHEDYVDCISTAQRRALRDFDRLPAPKALVVASRR